MSEQVSARRQPAQQRSRDRLDRILDAAKALIAENGSDRVKVSEVATRAEMSIGALYQYFPDKSAVIRTLAERYSAECRACIAAALTPVRDLDGLRLAYEGLLDQYYELFLADPAMRDVWSGMQADKQLMALELQESRASGALLCAALRRARPRANPKKIAASAFMVWQLGEAAVRLAISLERKEGDALIAAFKRMTWREMSQP